LKQFLGGTHKRNDEEVKKMVKDRFTEMVADFDDAHIHKIAT
jgi:hypothetical protein